MKREWFPPAVSTTASRLSWLWVFFMFNTAYIDINTLYYSVFINHHAQVHYTQMFLLGAAVLVEIPTAMVILSRMLGYRWNRLTNVIVGVLLTVVQIATLFVGTPTLAYGFISAILIATSGGIAWYAWNWSEQAVLAAQVNIDSLDADSV
jgi:hypothetical protein